MRVPESGQDLALASGWALALIIFLAGYMTAGYSGWGTGFAAWSLLALGLRVATTRHLQATAREPRRLGMLSSGAWAITLIIAVGSHLWFARGRAFTEEPSRIVSWLLLGLVWSIFVAELCIVACVTYAAASALCAGGRRESAT